MIKDVFDVITIDDDTSILDAYVSILAPIQKNEIEDAISELEKLFGEEQSKKQTQKSINFEIHQANCGIDGIELFRKFFNQGKAIPVCIIDMRMPNGIDGLETASRIKAIDPDVNIIISTAYSDKSLLEITEQIQNNIYYVRKPFNSEEIYQLVYSLSLSYKALKAYQELNIKLENRVKSEVEKSRQKDAIMLHQAKLASHGETISNIAHQWRQPLSSLAMVLNKMKLRMTESDSNDKEYFIDNIFSALNSIEYMSQTINDFRSQVEPNNEKIFFRISEVIDKCILLVNKSLTAANISIVFNPSNDTNIVGYPEDIKQILLVLLNNAKDAIQSQNKQGIIQIRVEEQETKCCIYVSDNGGGVKNGDIDHVFEPYFTTKHKSQGTGLGLYMASRIAQERLNGSIQVYNEDKGACFCLEIGKY